MRKIKYLICVIISIFFLSTSKVSAIELRNGIDSFPLDYQGYLRALKDHSLS